MYYVVGRLNVKDTYDDILSPRIEFAVRRVETKRRKCSGYRERGIFGARPGWRPIDLFWVLRYTGARRGFRSKLVCGFVFRIFSSNGTEPSVENIPNRFVSGENVVLV